MNFISPNKANNIAIADATAFISKMIKLGLRIGPLYLDESEGGAFETSYVAVSDVPADELDGANKYNCIVFAGGNWHNVAAMKLEWGQGTVEDFRQVYEKINPNGNSFAALLNIPGAYTAVEALIAAS